MSHTNGSNQNGQSDFKYIGKPRRLYDGLEKVSGYAKFTADVKLPNMAHVRPILSPYAHAKILSIDSTEAEQLPGVIAILKAEDLMTRDRVINSRNSAILAKERVLWVGQPVVAVVAETEQAAADAAELVFIDYDPLPAAVHLEEAIKPDAPQVWPTGLPQEGEDMSSLHAQVDGGEVEAEASDKPNNTLHEHHFERGDVEAGFAEATVVIERTYKTSMLHQAYMEPHASVADPDPLGRSVTIYTSTQGQHSTQDEVARLLGMTKHEVVIEPMTMGGGFGAKYGIVEPLATAVALAVRRPVRLVLTRSEDFLATTPAPEIIIKLKTGARADGTIAAIQATILVDNGIFSFSHGPIVAYLTGGYYKCDHVKLDAYEINTHKMQAGAYRAPGAPHATFALESNMEDMAAALKRDPLEFRLQNVVEGGEMHGVGRPWPQKLGAKACLEALKEHPLWKNRQPGDGVGLALGGWPTVMGSAEAICRVDTDGSVRVHVGNVDVTGNSATYALITAETLGVNPDDVFVINDNTTGAYGPGSGGSQVTYTVAGAVDGAAQGARTKLLELPANEFEAAVEDLTISEGEVQVVGVPDKTINIGQLAAKARQSRNATGPIVGEGHAAPPENGPGFAAHLVQVKVDPETGTITPLRYVSVQDVGFALNPLLVEGQIHGGSMQSLGMGLTEALVFDDSGQLLTGSFLDYAIPRPDTTPGIETQLIENRSPHGPFGARGIGEPPITPGPAALANAVKDAVGVRLTELPLTAERVWQALVNK